jgi:hypothetical protein
MEQMAEHMIASFADVPRPIDFSGLVDSRCQTDMRADGFGGFEAGRIVLFSATRKIFYPFKCIS